MWITAVIQNHVRTGNHTQFVVLLEHVLVNEGETTEQALERVGILNKTVYVLKGRHEPVDF